MRRFRPTLLHCIALNLAAGLATGACTSDDAECRVGADCPSGACSADGRCLDAEPSTTTSMANTGGGGMGQGGASTSAGGMGQGAGTGGSGLCAPNRDGIIERNEVPLGPGLSATFRIAQDATFDTGGTPDGDGYTWDLAQTFPGDELALVETIDLAGQWYEELFPGASYAVKLRESEDLLGVFELTPTALLLRGVVSTEDGFQRTELEYDPAVTVLSFPFEEGDSWTTDSIVSGLALGVITAYSEEYVSTVDKHGTLTTPFGEFPVLRVHTALDRTSGGFPLTTIQTHAFVTECFGTVASVASQDGESATEFNDAAELRRLAP